MLQALLPLRARRPDHLFRFTDLHRQCAHLMGRPGSVSSYVTDAFEVLSRIEVCKRAFPLSIVGFEARTDAQRKLVLTIISNTQEEITVQSYVCKRKLIELFWNLNDLDEIRSTTYMSKLSLVISSSDFLPTFI